MNLAEGRTSLTRTLAQAPLLQHMQDLLVGKDESRVSTELEELFPIQQHTLSIHHPRRRKTLALPISFIAARSSGQKKGNLVILPGASEPLAASRPYLFALRNAYDLNIIAVDYTGFRNIDLFEKHFDTFLREQGIEGDIILWGTSLGGLLAREYHKTHPDKIRGLIMSHTAGKEPKNHFSRRDQVFLRILHAIAPVVPWKVAQPIMRRMRELPEGKSLEGIDEQFYTFWQLERERHGALMGKEYSFLTLRFMTQAMNRQGEKWDGSVLWLQSHDDKVFTPSAQGEVETVYANAEVRDFPADRGHNNMHAHTQQVLAEIEPFIQKLVS